MNDEEKARWRERHEKELDARRGRRRLSREEKRAWHVRHEEVQAARCAPVLDFDCGGDGHIASRDEVAAFLSSVLKNTRVKPQLRIQAALQLMRLNGWVRKEEAAEGPADVFREVLASVVQSQVPQWRRGGGSV